jgi:selenocysteine-specific elongation factor
VTAHRVVTTAGHVDHGKSTLLRQLTGMEPDRLDEEQRRGLTLDLGFVWTGLGDQQVAFVDVPGHERFVGTMLAGAGAAPAALLVVAADDGWSAQSSEHRDVLDLLDVPAVAVAVTKVDLVDPGRVGEVVEEVTVALAGTSLAGAPVVEVDGASGRGLDRLREVLASRLAALPVPADVGRPRLWVDRAFAISGAGTVVTGMLVDGALQVGDRATLLPGGQEVRIRGMQSLGAAVERVPAGSRVALNLAGISHQQVTRGDVVVGGGGPWRATREADLWVRTLPGQWLERTGAWHVHVGTARSTARLLPTTGAIGPDEEGPVRVLLDHPLVLVAGDRAVLREAGRRATVAGGRVVDPAPRRRPRGRAERREHAAALAEAAAGGAVSEAAADGAVSEPAADGAVSEPAGGGAVSEADTGGAVGEAAGRAGRLTAVLRLGGGVRPVDEALAAAGWPPGSPLPDEVVPIGDHLVSAERVEAWVAAVRSLGAGVHDREAITSAVVGRGAPAGIGAALADHLTESGVLVRAASGHALAEHADAATVAAGARVAAFVAELAADPFSPPDLGDLAARHGVDHRELTTLVHRGEVVRAGRIGFARSAVAEAVTRLERLAAVGDGTFTASQAKEAWGTSRRFAIPLLEHLDAIGVTRFDGQLRRLTDRRP